MVPCASLVSATNSMLDRPVSWWPAGKPQAAGSGYAAARLAGVLALTKPCESACVAVRNLGMRCAGPCVFAGHSQAVGSCS